MNMINYLIYAVIHILMLLAAIGISAVSVAFSDVAASFNSSVVLTGWVMSIYLLVSTAVSVLVGKVCEILGKKKTFLICAGLFVVGSLLSALAPNIYILIIARFIQAVGGGGSTPVIVGIVADIFPNSRQRALGYSLSIASVGSIIGPTIGSWLVEAFGWRSIFWFNVPFGLLIIILAGFLLKGDRGHTGRIDYAGAGYFSGALFAIMFGLAQINRGNAGMGWWLVGVLLAAGVILAAVFIRHEFKAREPIIDLELLRRLPFAAGNYNAFIYGICIFGLSSLVPLYATAVYGLTIIQTGLILSLRSIGMIVATLTAGNFVVKWGYRRPLIMGTMIMFLVVLVLALQPHPGQGWVLNINSLTMLCILMLIMGIGMGIASPASVNATVDLEPRKASIITGVMGMFRQGGGALEIAIVTFIVQLGSSAASGFRIAFLATALFILTALPAILVMPARVIRTPR
jgi:MFS family permease